MKCLVTGAAGFVGRHLCAELVRLGHDVTAMTPLRSVPDQLHPDCHVEFGDVTDRAYVDRAINEAEPDWVFHLAASAIVRQCEADPVRALATNVMGTTYLLEALRRQVRQPSSVVVATSDKAYGDAGGIEYTEETPLRPGGVYETSKACQDHVALAYARLGLPVKVIRCANTYGPGDPNTTRLIPQAIRCARLGDCMPIYGSSIHAVREWLHVSDAVTGYLTVAKCGVSGEAYNCGSGETQTPYEVAKAVAALMNAPTPAVTYATAYPEIAEQRMCSCKLRALGWSPQVTLSSGLEALCAWARPCAS